MSCQLRSAQCFRPIELKHPCSLRVAWPSRNKRDLTAMAQDAAEQCLLRREMDVRGVLWRDYTGSYLLLQTLQHHGTCCMMRCERGCALCVHLPSWCGSSGALGRAATVLTWPSQPLPSKWCSGSAPFRPVTQAMAVASLLCGRMRRHSLPIGFSLLPLIDWP